MSKSQCGPDVPPYNPSTYEQAEQYANNQILWSHVYYSAWGDESLMNRLKAAAKKVDSGEDRAAVNNLLTDLATENDWPDPVFPEGVLTQFVFDEPRFVHLRVPAYQNMPSAPIDMVPYNI